MALLVKDANTATQPISTQVDAAGNLVPVHTQAVLSGAVASPVTLANPMPVMNTAGTNAIDGSGAIVSGGTAQSLFSVEPANGFMVANTSSANLYVSDVGAASAGGTSFPIAPGATFVTPSGYNPAGPVSIFGATTGQTFAARRW